ncbi:MAG: tRNA lysidine(34) synthetase TilS, partial [Chloroflexota bacterium]|nr:tRNA lysidine(34) synthetase TilS [Chloroflexota bacterium]
MKNVGLKARAKSFIEEHRLILPGQKVVVGVSGGADSVCLLHILAGWREELGIELHIAHLNHQLRGAESDGDAGYVAELADSLNIPATIARQDAGAYRREKKCSMEEAARELRYKFLAGVAADVGARRVAIGHTRDDQVETILMHVLRGTGTYGLRGLEPSSPVPFCRPGASSSHSEPPPPCHSEPEAKNLKLLLIRPLLDISRQETQDYCLAQQLRPRVDSSNLSLSFFRNRIRLELLPLLREYNPEVDGALLRLAKISREDSSFIEQRALELWDEVSGEEGNVVYLDKGKVGSLPPALQSCLIRLAIGRVLGDTRDIELKHVEAAGSLLDKPVGKMVSLPHGLLCLGAYDKVVIGRQSQVLCQMAGDDEWGSLPLLPDELPLKIPAETALPGWRVIASISTVIASEAPPPTVITSEAKQSRGGFVAEFD